MDAPELRQRLNAPATPDGDSKPATPAAAQPRPASRGAAHPGGRIKHNLPMQLLRLLLFFAYAVGACLAIHATQLLGAPLYLLPTHPPRHYYYAYMARTKAAFGVILITVTQFFAPTTVRLSGSADVAPQLRLDARGRPRLAFPARLVLIANHQLYTDWCYLWWAAYAARAHGRVCIVLKESLRYAPVLGPGMMFFGFVFLARNWARDRPRVAHRLRQLRSADPMWFLLFPEGTNLSANTRKRSAAWAAKTGIPDFKHQLLPRSTGLQFCVDELRGTVEYVYDVTVAYEGVPPGGYGQDYFTLRSTYFQGRPPKSVNMYWRRFRVADIPTASSPAGAKTFEAWLMGVWREKEALLAHFAAHGRFPASPGGGDGAPTNEGGATSRGEARSEGKAGWESGGYLEAEVGLRHWSEVLLVFDVVLGWALLAAVLRWAWRALVGPRREDKA